MASDIQFPYDGDASKTKPSEESLNCGMPSQMTCLSSSPDCSGGSESGLVAAIEVDKDKKKKQILSDEIGGDDEEEKKSNGENASLDVAFGQNLNCCFCFKLLERPITIACGHNYCFICFHKWIDQGKRTCAKCCYPISHKVASNPRINSSLVSIIRLAKASKSADAGTAKVLPFTRNQDCPENAFRAKRAKKIRRMSAHSGRICVTTPSDHFGPIPAEHDPVRNQGVLVGESWDDRVECRQWGVHSAHISGISGQSDYGAQSVALTGGYEDDEDHGDWFLFTGSGGIDLSGIRGTNVDQTLEKLNEALKISCKLGYPVRVVRSYKKHSVYAPDEGVRYDGIYRIEKCWRKVRTQGGFKVCRYLFVRCDNEPAPWTSDEHGDRPRPLPNIPELNVATNLFERKESPSWDFDEGEGRWRWMKPPPASRKSAKVLDHERKGMMMALTCLLLSLCIIFLGSSSILYRV